MYIFIVPEIFIILAIMLILGIIGQGATAIARFASVIASHWGVLVLISFIINVFVAIVLSGDKELRVTKKGGKRSSIVLLIELVFGVTMYNSPCWLFILGIFVPFARTVDGIIDSVIFVIWMLLSGSIALLIWGLGFKLSSGSLEKGDVVEYVLVSLAIFWASIVVTFIFNLGDVSSILGPYHSAGQLQWLSNILELINCT